jgi:WD40 repeat protein/serine/threonine protein kinase
MTEREIFVAARGKSTDAERAAYLDGACGGDPALRHQVETLLREYDRLGNFLESPAQAPADTVAHTPAEGPGERIGPYKLVEQVGEGGMGSVWMAQQTEPVRRLVALKVIKPGMDSRQVLARFEAERQALALMDHQNIAKVFDGGIHEGRPYFVMELVKGVPITRYCDDHHLTCRERLGLFVDVCRAVQHAHQKGIIHRDLKPSNVLVAQYDGRPVPKVIDFGIAKAAGQPLTEKTLVTGFGAVVGTPEYMSPEQAELNNQDIDTRSDVYSLGVLLYELLTGTTPLARDRVKGTALLEVLRLVREEEPPRPSTRVSTATGLPDVAARRGLEPRKLRGLLRGEPDWIVMKALEKDRARRYETASGLAEDLQRYLNDEPVQACPPSAWYRLRKFARRNRRAVATAGIAGLGLALAVAALATSTVMIARALRSETYAKGQLADTLERERVEAYFHRITLAHHALTADDLGRALELLRDCPEDLRGWEWHYLMRLCRVEPLVLRDRTEVNSVAFSPDGRFIAAACGDGTIKVWEGHTGKAVQRFDAHSGPVFSVAYHPGGKHLATVGADHRVKVWDLTTGKAVFSEHCDTVHHVGAAYCVAFSPGDGHQLGVGNDGAVEIWDWRNRRVEHSLPGHQKRAINLAFSPDGSRLASGNWRGSVMLWDPQAGGDPLRSFAEPREARFPVAALAFSPDGGQLATASYGRRVDVWATTTGELLRRLPHGGLVMGVAYCAGGRRLVSSGEDKTVRVWDTTDGREVLVLRGHDGICGCVASSPDGHRLASAGVDGTIRIWDATPLQNQNGQEVLSFAQHGDEVWTVAVSPDGQKIASGGMDTRVKVWDARTGLVSAEFARHTGVIFSAAWDPEGKRLASAGRDGELFTVKVWEVPPSRNVGLPTGPAGGSLREAGGVPTGKPEGFAQTGQPAFELPRGPEEYFAVAFSPDGKHLVTGRADGAVQVWDARNGKAVGTLGTHDRQVPVRGVVFSHRGQYLASASADGQVRLWDATRLTEKQVPLRIPGARHRGQGLTLAFSPDGRRLVTGGERHTAKIWDVETGKELKTLEGHGGDIHAVAFSPNGLWVAAGGEGSTVRVWDSRTGNLVRSFRGHTGLVSSLAFSTDGRLVSGSRDRTVKVWDVSRLDEAADR